MPTKAELQQVRDRYYALLNDARLARSSWQFEKAIELSVESWNYIDGMMQFERKYEDKKHSNVEAIELVLTLAPLLFDLRSLEQLAELLKSARRIEKNTSVDLNARLEMAIERTWTAHRIWSHLELAGVLDQKHLRSLAVARDKAWTHLIERWRDMGVVQVVETQNARVVHFATQLGATVPAKCPACGIKAKGPKAKLLEPLKCPKCKNQVTFVLLAG